MFGGGSEVSVLRDEAVKRRKERERAAMEAADVSPSAVGACEFVSASEVFKRKGGASSDAAEDGLHKRRVSNVMARLGRR